MFWDFKEIADLNKPVTMEVGKDQGIDVFMDVQRRAAIADNSTNDMLLRNEYETKHGECMVRESLSKCEKNVRLWQRNLKDEIQNVTKQHKATESYLRDVAKAIVYFKNIENISKMCKTYRQALENPNEDTQKTLDMEIATTHSADDAMQDQLEKLKICLGKLEDIKVPLVADLDAKAQNFLALRGCKNAKPLLSDQYDFEDPMLPYREGQEKQWEKNVSDLIQYSRSLRQDAEDKCIEAENATKEHKAQIASNWMKASRAIAEEVYKDRYIVDRCQHHISQVEKCISCAKLRIDSMHDEFEMDDREKMLEVWRLHRLNYRPPTENLEDGAVVRIASELNELEKRMRGIAEQFMSDENLLRDLYKLQTDLTKMMNAASKRLHANRENIQGIRRTVVIDGLNS